MFILKWANPVYDSEDENDDDEDEIFRPPQKRQRTSTEGDPKVLLSCCDHIESGEDEIDGFALRTAS
jgi:hypothetical protein